MSNAITTYKGGNPDLPTPDDWKLMVDMASALVPTGFLPESIKNPQQAVAIMLKGRELGVPPMYALSNIVIVKGKPTVSAEMMLALIYRDHGKQAIRVKESTNQLCTVEYRLPGWSVTSYTFTIEDASNAGLDRNPTWKQYPAAMLRARCISAVARMAFPESIAGMYSPGELGEAVAVTDDGEVVSTVTGEITSTATVDDVTARTQSRQDAPERDEEADDVSGAMRKLHGAARDAGITHDALHNWAEQQFNVDSLKLASPRMMRGLAEKLADPVVAENFRAKYEPVSDNVMEAELVEVGAQASMIEPDVLAAIDAAAKAKQRIREAGQ